MFWIALLPTHDSERLAWGWRALQFTPRVADLDEALVLEVASCEKLWGGRKRLLRKLFRPQEALTAPLWAQGSSSLVALARLRMKKRGEEPSCDPDDFPLDALTAARPHLLILERIGCGSWGDLRKLPRAGLSRRFGKELAATLDRAYGEQPESHAWHVLPEHFDLNVELSALATSAPELMWTAQRLLSQLQIWLQARNRGVLAFELEWKLDLKRLDGKLLPPTEKLEVRTAQPTQDMAHLRRLVNEQLSRTAIAAPANHLRLRSMETVPWGGMTTSLLPQDSRKGEQLHQLVERLSVRLGEANVLVAQANEDHRPERMQKWVSARAPHPHPLPRGEREQDTKPPRPGGQAGRGVKLPLPSGERVGVRGSGAHDAIYPTWLLPEPLELEVRGDTAYYGGPLRRLARLYRVETGWWEEGGPALRDYFIARSEEAGLVWIFRERPSSTGRSRWYLQGLYA